MALGLVELEYLVDPAEERTVYRLKALGKILMYSGFADAKSLGSLTYSGIMVDDIVSNGDRSFLNIILQEVTPQNTFLHCMKYSEGL